MHQAIRNIKSNDSWLQQAKVWKDVSDHLAQAQREIDYYWQPIPLPETI